MASTSTRNSGRVKPDTIKRVEQGFGSTCANVRSPDLHVLGHVFPSRDISVDSKDILGTKSSFREDFQYGREADLCLFRHAPRHGSIRTNSELARRGSQPGKIAREALGIGAEGRCNRLGFHPFHVAAPSIRLEAAAQQEHARGLLGKEVGIKRLAVWDAEQETGLRVVFGVMLRDGPDVHQETRQDQPVG